MPTEAKRTAVRQLAIPVEVVERKIIVLRGYRVLLDRDLAELYEVKPIALR
jgi:hypothetical protein